MNKLYYLAVDAVNVQAEVRLNGAPMFVHRNATSISQEKPAQNWLVKGDNFLSVKLFAIDGDDKISGGISVHLYEHDADSEFPTPKRSFLKMDYPDKEKPVAKSAFEIVEKFEFPDELSGNLWGAVNRIETLDPEDEISILKLVEALQGALVKGNSKVAVELQEFKLKDDALLQGKDLQKLKSITEMNYKMLHNFESLKASPVTLEEFKFDVIAENKVVYVLRSNGENAVHIESDDMVFEIPVFVSKVEGQWAIVR